MLLQKRNLQSVELWTTGNIVLSSRKSQRRKRKQHVTEVKGVRLSPVIDINDFNTKVRQAKGWLEDGNRVKVDMLLEEE